MSLPSAHSGRIQSTGFATFLAEARTARQMISTYLLSIRNTSTGLLIAPGPQDGASMNKVSTNIQHKPPAAHERPDHSAHAQCDLSKSVVLLALFRFFLPRELLVDIDFAYIQAMHLN